MDSNSVRGRGRPPATTSTMPVFLGVSRSRVKVEVVMSGPTSRELRQYIDWAGGVAMMEEAEVMVRLIDHALNECFRSDKAWQKDRTEFLAPAAAPPARAAAAKGDTATPPAAASDKSASEKTAERPGTGTATAAAAKTSQS